MRRAREDDSFTWEPFDHGRGPRMAALVAVGLCAGLVGLVAGRVSSGGSVEIARAPPPQSAAVMTKNQTAFAAPASSPMVLANPVTEKQTSHLDLTTPIGRGFIAFLSALAEDERQRILKRANAGRVEARKRGAKFGRKPKLSEHQHAEALKRLAAGESCRQIGKTLGVHHATVSRLQSQSAT